MYIYKNTYQEKIEIMWNGFVSVCLWMVLWVVFVSGVNVLWCLGTSHTITTDGEWCSHNLQNCSMGIDNSSQTFLSLIALFYLSQCLLWCVMPGLFLNQKKQFSRDRLNVCLTILRIYRSRFSPLFFFFFSLSFF